MERLTYRGPVTNDPVSKGACKNVSCSGDCDNCKIGKIISRLCEYEDTGLTPEEIEALKTSSQS